jgi:hypothetical protein
MTGLRNGEDDRGRPPDGELARLRTLWLRVVAFAVADQDDAWMRGGVRSGRDLVLEAAGIEPGYWDRVMLPVADAIRAERARTRYLVHVEELAAAGADTSAAAAMLRQAEDRLVRLRESRAVLVTGELARSGDEDG